MASSLTDVNQLSDDEPVVSNSVPSPEPKSKAKLRSKRMPARLKQKQVTATKRLDVRALRYRVDGSCGCQCLCFRQFREAAIFSKLIQVQKTLESLDKLEQDKYVFSSDRKPSLNFCKVSPKLDPAK